MSLIDAMEALRGQPYSVILDTLRQQTEPVVGKIQGSQLKLLQSFIGATGLRNRLANATPEQAAAAASVTEAIQSAYLAREDSYSINLAVPQISQLLSDAVNAGVLTVAEKAYLVQIATYQKPLWPHVTLRDVVSYFEPLLVDVGEWQEFTVTSKRRLVVNSQHHVVENPIMQVQVSESHNGTDWTEWRNAMSFGVPAGLSFHPIVQSDLQRRFRWRGVYYKLNLTVEAV